MFWKSLKQASVQEAVRELGLAGKPVCIHSSLRSFGRVADGPATILQAFLDEGCTVVVPTFSFSFIIPPPNGDYRQNGAYPMACCPPNWDIKKPFTPASTELDLRSMGAIPKYVVNTHDRVRGKHPLCSFSALGPLAADVIQRQDYLDIYAPFDRMAELGGAVVLMGVHYNKCTLLHNAEKHAGITLMRRWAKGPDDAPVETENGSCSTGFVNFEETLYPILQTCFVGSSFWRVLSIQQTMERAIAAIKDDIRIRHCGHDDCQNCNDITRGGPILQEAAR